MEVVLHEVLAALDVDNHLAKDGSALIIFDFHRLFRVSNDVDISESSG